MNPSIVKKLVVGGFDGDEEWQCILVVPEHVSAREVMESEATCEMYDCLCECYAEDDADRLVIAWNTMVRAALQ